MSTLFAADTFATDSFSTDTPDADVAPWARLRTVATGLWRVTDRSGRVRGHVRRIADGLSVRFRAERFDATRGRFRTFGEFSRAQEAFDCLRYLR